MKERIYAMKLLLKKYISINWVDIEDHKCMFMLWIYLNTISCEVNLEMYPDTVPLGQGPQCSGSDLSAGGCSQSSVSWQPVLEPDEVCVILAVESEWNGVPAVRHTAHSPHRGRGPVHLTVESSLSYTIFNMW